MCKSIQEGGRTVEDENEYTFANGGKGGAPVDSFTIRQMLACNMHLGHSVEKWHPNMSPFIFGERQGIHVLDLEKSLFYLRKAVAVLQELVSLGANVLFVGAKKLTERIIYDLAIQSGQYYVNGPWTKGLIRNRQLLLGNSIYLADLVVVFDYADNPSPILEAHREGIPSIAICDTNCDPNIVTYPIPANDDSIDSLDLIAQTLLRGALAGRQQLASRQQNTVTEKILTAAEQYSI